MYALTLVLHCKFANCQNLVNASACCTIPNMFLSAVDLTERVDSEMTVLC